MSLAPGRRLFRKKWTETPMPKWCIDRVHCMGERQQQTWMPRGAPTISSSKRQEGQPPLLENDESSLSSECTNNENDELVDENADEDAEHDV